MKFTFTIPDSLPEMTVKVFLEDQLLIPRKIRHFLRIKKHILINQEEVHWHQTSKSGDECQLIFDEEDYPTKEEATAVLLGTIEEKFKSFKHQTGTVDNNTKVLTATLKDGVLNENAKTIVFPDVPNIFGILPLYISSTEVPITYHYEVNGDILTMYAEKVYNENGIHLVYPMKFKKVQK